jgi:hypothetical protein
MLDPASCREWAEYIKGSVQKWTAAKCFRLSSREGGSPLNRRMSNEELDTNVKAFSNVRDAVGPYFEIAVHCHWEYDFFDALRLASGIEKIRPRWIEDPMPPNARGGRAFAQTCAPAAPFCQPRKRLFRSLRLPRRLSLKPSLCWTPGFPGCAAPNSTPAGAAPTQVPGAESGTRFTPATHFPNRCLRPLKVDLALSRAAHLSGRPRSGAPAHPVPVDQHQTRLVTPADPNSRTAPEAIVIENRNGPASAPQVRSSASENRKPETLTSPPIRGVR